MGLELKALEIRQVCVPGMKNRIKYEKREHSLSILKVFSSETRQSMKRRITTER